MFVLVAEASNLSIYAPERIFTAVFSGNFD